MPSKLILEKHFLRRVYFGYLCASDAALRALDPYNKTMKYHFTLLLEMETDSSILREERLILAHASIIG